MRGEIAASKLIVPLGQFVKTLYDAGFTHTIMALTDAMRLPIHSSHTVNSKASIYSHKSHGILIFF